MEGVPYVPTRAVVSGPNTAPVTLEQRFQVAAPLAAILDPRFSVGFHIRDRFHGTGHLGWWMSGLEVSVLPRGEQVDTPLVLTLGAQVNAPARLIGFTSAAVWDARAQLSVHPAAHGVRLMLGAGFSAGRQKHDLALPDELAHPPDVAPAPALLRSLRREGRLEGVIGFSLARGDFRFALAAQPFYVVAHGDLSTLPCSYCLDQLRVDSFDASWGAAFTLTILGSRPPRRSSSLTAIDARRNAR